MYLSSSVDANNTRTIVSYGSPVSASHTGNRKGEARRLGVAPNKWKELLSVIEDARRSSDTESNPRPYVIEGNASSSRPGRASKDGNSGFIVGEKARNGVPFLPVLILSERSSPSRVRFPAPKKRRALDCCGPL